MNNLMDAFYASVGKTLVEDILNGDGEYLIHASHQDGEVHRLLSALNQDTASIIDNLLAEQLAIGALRERAYFRAGFRVAVELAR